MAAASESWVEIVSGCFGAAGGEEWQTVARHLELSTSPAFSFIVVLVPHQAAARVLAAVLLRQLEAAGQSLEIWEPATPDDLAAMSDQLLTVPTGPRTGAIWIMALGAESGLDRPGWSQSCIELALRLNEHRDALRAHVHVPLFLVGTPDLKRLLRETAPDLWSVRTLVVELETETPDIPAVARSMADEIASQARRTPLRRLVEAATAGVFAAGEATARATAYLVTPERAITAARPLIGQRLPLRLAFPAGEVHATIEHSDIDVDCAVLHLAVPHASAQPLALREHVEVGEPWQAYGISSAVDGETVLASGHVESVPARERQAHGTLVLHGESRMPATLAGFSGSPVMVRDGIIGHVQSAGSAPVIFACPGAAIRRCLSASPGRKRARGRLLFTSGPGLHRLETYIHRRAEEQSALHALHLSKPLCLEAPRQFGKTSMLRALVQEFRAKRPGITVVWIDLSTFTRSGLTGAELVEDVARRILDAMEVPRFMEAVRHEILYKYKPGDPVHSTRWVRHLARSLENALVLVFDELDALLAAPDEARRAFFATLRSWCDSVENIAIAMAAARPLAYIELQDWSSSLHARTLRVPLEELRAPEVEELVHLHGIQANQRELEALMEWIGGHPSLWTLVIHDATWREVSLKQVAEDIGRDGGSLRDHLMSQGLMLRERPELHAVVRSLFHGPQRILDANIRYDLFAIGLVKLEPAEVVTLRLPLYEKFLRHYLV